MRHFRLAVRTSEKLVEGEMLNEPAPALFQQQWQLYRKFVDNNHFYHREVYGQLHRILVEEAVQPFRFLRRRTEKPVRSRNFEFHATNEWRSKSTIALGKANQVLVDLLGQIATKRQATPAQVALGWLLAQKPWIVPIPDTTKLHRLEENIAGASVDLSAADLREIDDAASKITVQGARYPEKVEQMIDR